MGYHANWDRIHELPVYDPKMMRRCAYIDNSIYVQSTDTYYSPILRFAKDRKDDRVYMEIYLERLMVDSSTTSQLSPSTLFTMHPSQSTYIDCSECKVTKSFSKDEIAGYLEHSIESNTFIWECDEVEEVLRAALMELADKLTHKIKKTFVICSWSKHILSHMDGTVVSNKDGSIAGKFGGVVIQASPGTRSEITSYNMKLIIPKLVFNEVYFNLKDCNFVYTDKRHGFQVTGNAGMLKPESSMYTMNLRECRIDIIGEVCLPDDGTMEEIMAKKLYIPQSKFENRIMMLDRRPTAESVVKVVRPSNVRAAQRFKSLTK
jgi:hypothetical protein